MRVLLGFFLFFLVQTPLTLANDDFLFERSFHRMRGAGELGTGPGIIQGHYGVATQLGSNGYTIGGFVHLELIVVDSVAMYNQEKALNGFVGDGKLLAFVAVGADGSFSKPLFAVKAVGNATVPLPFFPHLPALSAGLEDVTFEVKNGDVDASALLGISMFVPVSAFTDILKGNAYIGATVGPRFNTDAKETGWAYSPKIRYVNGKVSVDTHYLKTFSNEDVKETRYVLTLSYNGLVKKNDHAGVHVSNTKLEKDENDQKQNRTDSVFFYGWKW